MARDFKGKDESLTEQIRKYRDILAKDPLNLAFARLGEAYRRSRMLDESILICEEGLKYHPQYTTGRVTLARALYEKGDIDRAFLEFEKVIEQDPDNMISLRLLGEICETKKDIGRALELYKKILELNPRDTELQSKFERLSVDEIDPEELLDEVERTSPVAGKVEQPSLEPPADDEKLIEIEDLHGVDPLTELLGEEPIEAPSDLQDEILKEQEESHSSVELEPPVDDFAEDVFTIEPLSDEELADLPDEINLPDPTAAKAFSAEFNEAIDSLELGGDEKEQLMNDFDLASETIADLYNQQGHLERALLIYERISGKEPDNEEVKDKIGKVKSQLPIKRVAAIDKVLETWQREQFKEKEKAEISKAHAQISKLEEWLVHIKRNQL